MDGLTLILAGCALGLRAHADNGHLVIRGPKRARAFVNIMMAHKAEILAALADRVTAKTWPEAAREVFLERLGIADDLELDTSPGSPAWDVAVREAQRAAAGIPPGLTGRSSGLIDAALAAFASVGMPLTYVGVPEGNTRP